MAPSGTQVQALWEPGTKAGKAERTPQPSPRAAGEGRHQCPGPAGRARRGDGMFPGQQQQFRKRNGTPGSLGGAWVPPTKPACTHLPAFAPST